MLVNFLMNQADAGASWSMLGKSYALSADLDRALSFSDTDLGLTIRLAQSLGLHCSPNPDAIEDSAEIDKATVKYYIW